MPIATEFLMQNHIPFAYYDLDAPAALEAELGADLPDDPERAAAMATRRLQRGGAALIERVRQAWQGVVQAKRYGLDRIPAIVFDRNAAVYGVTDAEEALGVYRSRRDRPKP
jgi:integrating conjugative element protein (TIGR03757 family)